MSRRNRGVGRVCQATYRDPKRGTLKSKTWWLAYNRHGKEYRESSHSTRRPDAVRLLKQRLGEIGSGQFIGPDADKTTFDDLERMLLDDYQVNGRKTKRRAEGCLKNLRARLGHLRARDMTLDRLNAHVAARLQDGARPGTIQNELAILKRVLHLAERAGKARRPPFPILRVSNTRTGFFESEALRQVLAALPSAIQPVAEFGYLTGWRLGEILPLTWRQIDLKAGIIRLEPGPTKNDEGRSFPFRALPALAALIERRREATTATERETGRIIPWVFHRQGEPIRNFRGAWAKACIAAGLFRVLPPKPGHEEREKRPTRLFHDLRRTAVRNLERAGVSRSVAMKLTGHKTESVYRRYAIVGEGDLAQGVAKLASVHEEPAQEGRVIEFAPRSRQVWWITPGSG
jgi:integrase